MPKINFRSIFSNVLTVQIFQNAFRNHFIFLLVYALWYRLQTQHLTVLQLDFDGVTIDTVNFTFFFVHFHIYYFMTVTQKSSFSYFSIHIYISVIHLFIPFHYYTVEVNRTTCKYKVKSYMYFLYHILEIHRHCTKHYKMQHYRISDEL